MTPWRRHLYRELSNLTLSGKVLDLGGSRSSDYHGLFQGNPTFVINNVVSKYPHDITFDVEVDFPLEDDSFDGVMALNLLEHIYDHTHVLREVYRVLTPGGQLVIGLPFLMFVHPSPHDHWRYTGETLKKILEDAGFSNIEIKALGSGPGAVLVQILGGLRGGKYIQQIFRPLGWLLDSFAALCMPRYVLRERFPLGYVAVAYK